MFLPGEICPTLRPPRVVALHVVMCEVIGQKSADGIVVDSYLMKRRPEAKRGDHPSSFVLSCGRPAALRVNRRVDGQMKSTTNINGLRNISWPDYGPALLVIAQCGPACWVMWAMSFT